LDKFEAIASSFVPFDECSKIHLIKLRIGFRNESPRIN